MSTPTIEHTRNAGSSQGHTERKITLGEDDQAIIGDRETINRLHSLETSQATQAATFMGAQATQAAAQAGMMATVFVGAVALIGGILVGAVIRGGSAFQGKN